MTILPHRAWCARVRCDTLAHRVDFYSHFVLACFFISGDWGRYAKGSNQRDWLIHAQ